MKVTITDQGQVIAQSDYDDANTDALAQVLRSCRVDYGNEQSPWQAPPPANGKTSKKTRPRKLMASTPLVGLHYASSGQARALDDDLKRTTSVSAVSTMLPSEDDDEELCSVDQTEPSSRQPVQAPPRPPTEMLFDVSPATPSMAALVQQVRSLGESEFWGNDVLEGVSRKGGWKLNLLIRPREGEQPATKELCCFVVFKTHAPSASLSIKYVATARGMRGLGYGKKVVRWLQDYAQNRLTRSTVTHVACSSTAESVAFYQRLGFKKRNKVVDNNVDKEAKDEAPSEELVDGQRNMIWKVPPPKQKAQRSSGR